MRKAANAVNPAIKLIYQVVGTSYKAGGAIDTFISSTAAKSFDTLSLHPYRWPDFPAPDTWLAALITDTNAALKAKGLTMPIWFTEVGAPHHGNLDLPRRHQEPAAVFAAGTTDPPATRRA